MRKWISGWAALAVVLQAANVVAAEPAEIDAAIERLAKPGTRDAAVKELIAMDAAAGPALFKGLGDMRGEVRAGAAEVLRTLAKDPAKLPGWHDRAYWEARIAKLKAGMSVEEVSKILYPDLPGAQLVIMPSPSTPPIVNIKGPTVTMLMASGGSMDNGCRLDPFWSTGFSWGSVPRKSVADLPAPKPGELRFVSDQVTVLHNVSVLVASTEAVGPTAPADFTGTWDTWYVNGQKSSSAEFNGGKYDGVTQKFSDTGTLIMEEHLVAQIREGSNKSWYRSGGKRHEGQFAGGKKEGTWTNWYENGIKESEATYKADMFDGVSVAWFANGQKKSEQHYAGGKSEGTDEAWDEKGDLRWRREYKGGMLQSETKLPK